MKRQHYKRCAICHKKIQKGEIAYTRPAIIDTYQVRCGGIVQVVTSEKMILVHKKCDY